MINSIEVIGLTAAFLTTSAYIPQAYKAWKTKSAGSVSLSMYLIMLTGVVLWLIYGIYLNSLSMILANTATIILTSIIIFFKLKYK